MNKRLFFWEWLLVAGVQAQPAPPFAFTYDQRPVVRVNGKSLANPWVGGLNAVQYSTIRLNQDDRDDLVVFDRTTNKLSTFIATADSTGKGVSWQYAPGYENAFPAQLYKWVLLVDYDQDGRKDLFTGGATNVQVYRNESQGGTIIFRRVADPLETEGFGGRQPLYVSSSDLPAITDYDDDGDIDIITYDGSGNLIAYQQNMSVERTGKADQLDFKRSNTVCWGHFSKEYCNDFTFGLNCEDVPVSTRPGPAPSGLRPLHQGNTLTVLDTDGDGKKDLLVGFVSCTTIASVMNTGFNNEQATFTRFDSLFPARHPIEFPAFPATFWEDVDGDGIRDLLASPNVTGNDNRAFDFGASNWFYKNVGTNQHPDFLFRQTDFLQDGMLDVGENAAPALADMDGDEDLDLVVGYHGRIQAGTYKGGLWYFENQGTTKQALFSMVTTDYLGLAATRSLTYITPQFIDVDGNGSLDLVIRGESSTGVDILLLVNESPKGSASTYNLDKAIAWPRPSLMVPNDLLTITDVDGDLKPDALVSRSYFGTILYYRNSGSALRPQFQLQNQTFGGFNGDDQLPARARSLVVADLNGDSKKELLVAGDNGTIRVYDFPVNPDALFLLLDSLTGLGVVGAGLVVAAGDLDGDQLPELLVGSRAGGLRYLKNTASKSVVTGTESALAPPWVFPNPTARYLTVRPPQKGKLELITLLGQTVLTYQVHPAERAEQLDLTGLPAGRYLVRLTTIDQQVVTENVILLK